MHPLKAALAAAIAAIPVSPCAAQTTLTPDEFLDRAEGRTLTFVRATTGELVGVEQFLSRKRTVWTRADGSCAYGEVTVEGPELCFAYEDDLPGRKHCWWPFEMEGELHVRYTEGPSVQRVEEIGDRPVICEARPNV